jgi:hypothetical protein
MEPVIDQVVQYLGAILAAALVAVVVQVFRKLGFSLDAERQAQLEYYAKQAVLKVEEEAANYAKTHTVKLDPETKLRRAISAVVAKLPRVDEAEAAAVVKAALPQVGLGAAAVRLGEALRTPKAKK